MKNAEEADPQSVADYLIRPAVETDLQQVFDLIHPLMLQRKLLRRTRAETASLLSTGFVALFSGEVVGFSAVEIYSQKLAEIQALVVAPSHRSRGLGKTLVRRCVDLARQCGIMEIMAISASDQFLQEIGFDYSLPDQKRALFLQLRSREEVYRELDQRGE